MGGVPGGVQLNIARILVDLFGWRKPIRAVVWVWLFAGAGLVLRESALFVGRLVLPSQVKETRRNGRVLDAQA